MLAEALSRGRRRGAAGPRRAGDRLRLLPGLPPLSRQPAPLAGDLHGAASATSSTGFIAQGASRIAVINTGVSTEPVVHVVVRELYEEDRHPHRGRRHQAARQGHRPPDAADLRRPCRRARDLDHHGDRPVGRAARPRRRRLRQHAARSRRRSSTRPTVFSDDPKSGPDYSARGARGDPTLATAEKGRAMLEASIHDLVDGLKALFPEAMALMAGVPSTTDVIVDRLRLCRRGRGDRRGRCRARACSCSRRRAQPGGISICSAGGLRVADDAERRLRLSRRHLRRQDPGAGPAPSGGGHGDAAGGIEALARPMARRSPARRAAGNYPLPGSDTFGFVTVEDIPGFAPCRLSACARLASRHASLQAARRRGRGATAIDHGRHRPRRRAARARAGAGSTP